MKKLTFLFKIDSVVDLITNSSSELFVGKTNNTVDFVKEYLAGILIKYNEENSDNISFDDAFGRVEILDQYGAEELVKEYAGSCFGVLSQFTDVPSPPSQYDLMRNMGWPNVDSSDRQEMWKKSKEQHDVYVAEYLTKVDLSKIIGSVVIQSACDNTIPYEIWDDIEDTFSAERYHLG